MADDKNKNAADKAAKEAQAKAQREAAEAAKAKAAQEKARRDAEAKAKAEQEKAKAAQEKAAKEAEAKAQREAADAAKAKAAQEKARRDAEAKAKAEQEKARAAQEKAAKEAEAKAQKEAADAAKAKAAQEKAAKEAQARAQKEAAAKEKAQKNASKESKKAEKSAQIIAEAGPLPEGSATGKVKLTRKQKKALLEQQKQREKELVEAGEIPLRRRYKPRGLFWRILGVCLAFFMGIFATVGAIVGASAFLLTKKSRDVVDFVLDFTGSELSPNDILTEEYLNKTLSELIHDAQTNILDPLIGDPGNLTLKTLASFTPMVDTYLDDLVAEYFDDLGISIDLNELKEQRFADFVSYAKTSILPKVELGPLLELDTDVTLDKIDDNSPMYALCYGKYGTDYTIENNTIKMVEGKSPRNITDFVPSLKPDYNGVSPTAATDGGDDSEGLMKVLGSIELGTLLGLDILRPSEAESDDNNMLYTMCYGTKGVDFEFVPVEGSDIKILRYIGAEPPTTVDTLMNGTDGFVNGLSLGALLGLESEENLQAIVDGTSDNIMLYTLCYGTQDIDWKVENGKIVMLQENPDLPLTIGRLTDESNKVMDDLPLGEMLGLNTKKELDNRENNSLMYALCYGKEGEDYEVVDGNKIVMLPGGEPAKTLGDLSNNSQEVVNKLNVDDVLDVSAESDAVVRVVAYGNEMAKGDAEKGDLVDKDGYLVDENGNYKTEKVKKVVTDPETGEQHEEETNDLQYVGGGRYVIKEVEGVKTVQMLPDPNNPGKFYAKKTVGDLTKEDADLLDGITLGSIIDIDSNSSGIMKAMKEWTIDDLSDQDKIESLLLGDILEIEPKEGTVDEKPDDVSNIMWALREKSIHDLNDQKTIDDLHLSDVLEINEEDQGTSKILLALKDKTLDELGDQNTIDDLTLSQVLDIEEDGSTSKLLVAMKSWTLGDLSQQTRIERLKIGQLVDATTGIMEAMKDWRISDLNKQEKIDSLTLGDVIDIKLEDPATPQMLKVLHNKTLGEITKSIDTLTLEDVLGTDAFTDDDGNENKILAALRYKQIKELGDAINELTVEDVFGDEIWSYAKNYQEGQRPQSADKLTADKVDTFYYHLSREKVLTVGWYEGNDTDGYTKIDEVKEPVVAERYVERKVYLTRTASYYEVNYDDLNDTSKTYSGDVNDIHEDGYGFFYEDAEGNHIDLEVIYTYTLRDGAGAVPDGVRIQEEKVNDSDVNFYYIEKVDVSRRYAYGGATYAEDDETNVTKGYKEKDTGVPVDAYYAGVWYLLLGNAATMPKITGMGELVTGVADTINTMTLGNMYVHELITDKPDVDLTSIKTIIEAAGNEYPFEDSVTNLNQLTISQVITLISALGSAD